MITIFIALLFLVPAAALATNNTNSTIPPDCNDERCILEEDECMPFDPDKAMEYARKFLP